MRHKRRDTGKKKKEKVLSAVERIDNERDDGERP
jgi:hypothetical protein